MLKIIKRDQKCRNFLLSRNVSMCILSCFLRLRGFETDTRFLCLGRENVQIRRATLGNVDVLDLGWVHV